ncbi:uncharacterized protein TRIADDRAFT_61046 [Trichoplax adhaerens]|uniref:Uncharacterized protein n=1 Tax=Trichoplax adhaerens TaxID=10228 RepID=B3S9W2_TRIAD|nr:hypothetical protein TRIADDRAFT_61046 [Trichoplax adhaerens]EDV20336.1 hypothetical protein TRIADDRAFT_61046 [Trichoplax adhaerens]|eukprot:XP_002117030.1 hypothetical protein TRIADDRAFT_61046 [Trichoplax adhaerens]
MTITSCVKSRVKSLKDFLFASLAFPFGMDYSIQTPEILAVTYVSQTVIRYSTLVSSMFWILYCLEPDFVYPLAERKIVPVALNHIWHTLVFISPMLDVLLYEHKYPSRIYGHFCLATFALLYIGCIFWIAHVAKVWIYGVLETMSAPMVVVFCLVLVLVTILLYEFGYWLERRKKREEATEFEPQESRYDLICY